MPTTRSAAKQSTAGESAEGSKGKAPSTSEKRKVPREDEIEPTSGRKKARKRSEPAPENHEEEKTGESDHETETITINRAPVLQLWGSVVASFLYPELSWPACLSIGNAISSLCAMSKGRSIGVIDPPKEDKDGTKKRHGPSDGTKEVKVMGFSLQVKGDAALVGGKPKPLNEATLQNKFGVEEYDAVRAAFTESLQSWKGHEDELNTKAFHMYETFRPSVAKGQKGWGRKGELSTTEITKVVQR